MANNTKSSSLLLVANTIPTGSATGNPRNKVALKPGRSLMDWIRLGHSGKDLTGVGGKIREVAPEELAAHCQPQDAWIALKGIVYNVSHYMEYHPGGQEELMRGVGKDATHLFNEVHQWVNAESMLQKCVVGKLTSPAISPSLFAAPALPVFGSNAAPRKKSADVTDSGGSGYMSCTLSSKSDVTHNIRMLQLRLPTGVCLRVPTGHHVHLRASIQGTEICRSYTPVPASLNLDNNTIEEVADKTDIHLMIKIYDGGALTPHLDSLSIGDSVEVSSNAIGSFRDDQWQPRSQLVLLAAGTGFTPMAGLLLRALQTRPDRTVKLLFFNRQERDIPWRKQLESISENHPRFEVVHVLSEEGSGERIINAGLLRSALSGEESDPKLRPLVAVCGPSAFVRFAVRTLEEIGVLSEDIHVFDG